MMILKSVGLAELQQHEQATGANVTLGGYHMDKFCPLNEFELYDARLDAVDADRLFVLPDFGHATANGTCKLRDLLAARAIDDRARSFIDGKVDLRLFPKLAILIVSVDPRGGSLIVYDGNHRIIAQHLTCNTIQDVPAYVCVHKRINEWPFVPPAARK